MKTIVAAFLILTSSIAHAGALNECANLMGEYSCSIEGESFPLTLVAAGNELTIDIAGESQQVTVDGEPHRGPLTNVSSVGTCNNSSSIVIVSTDEGNVATTTINKIPAGLQYIIAKGMEMSFTCTLSK